MHHLCLITPQPLSKCCSCNNSNKNLCFFCLSLFLFSSSLYVVETKKEKKGSADKFKAEGSHRCAFVLSQRRARLYETVTQLRGEWWTAQFGFVTLRHTKQNRWPTASHPGSDIKQFCFFPAVLHFQHVFFFFFLEGERERENKCWNIPLPASFCYLVNHSFFFYIHQPSCKKNPLSHTHTHTHTHTQYEREVCISQNKCGINYNWLLLNPLHHPHTHTCPPPPPPQLPSYPSSLPPTHRPTPPLAKLPPSTPDRAPVAKRQRERWIEET